MMSPQVDRIASRRLLLQFLVASPLFTRIGSPAFAQNDYAPPRLPDPMVWAPRDLDKLISDPKEALDVFDFEPVAKKNVPPAHFGYMVTGIDDEVTLRANRDGFLKFQLRPRRLVDVSTIDMTIEIIGTKYDSPIVIAPNLQQLRLSSGWRGRGCQGRKSRQPPSDALHCGDHLDRGCDCSARCTGVVSIISDAEVGSCRSPCQTGGTSRIPGDRSYSRRSGASELGNARSAAAY
jgi:FMN-dependent dehydrogenase